MAYTVLDFETTGLDFKTEQVIEISAINLDDYFNEVGTFNTFVKLREGKELPEFITNLTGIEHDDLVFGMEEEDAFNLLRGFIGRNTVVAQYAPFDLAYLFEHMIVPRQYICTKSLTSKAEPTENSSLIPTCERLGINLENAHRAIDDCRATAEVLKHRLIINGMFGCENTLVVTEGRALNFIPRYTEEIHLKNGGILAKFAKGVI